jgi:putative transposase
MAHLGRYFLAEQPLHVIQRGNNREAVFYCDEDYERYREWLAAAAAENDCAIHAYVLMTNHVHLLVTPDAPESVPRMMQALGRRYVRYVNAAYRRTGTLWEGRYRAAPIDSDAYFLSCCRYIELNPVRAGMVRRPRDYSRSSYRAHALGKADALMSDHALYRALGRSGPDRQSAYRELFRPSTPASSRRCASPPMAAGRWVSVASRDRSPRRWAGGSRRCRRAGRRKPRRTNGN